MLKVRMLTSIAGKPNCANGQTCVTGEIVELEDKIAKEWIAEGMAAPVRDAAPAERAARS